MSEFIQRDLRALLRISDVNLIKCAPRSHPACQASRALRLWCTGPALVSFCLPVRCAQVSRMAWLGVCNHMSMAAYLLHRPPA